MSINGVCSIGNTTANPGIRSNMSNNADFSSVLNRLKNETGTDLDSIFEAASKEYHVPVNLLKAVAKVESNFRADATSSCGAMGITQLMPATAKSLGVKDAYDPEQNIMGGAKYLREMLDLFDGDTELAVAAYNAGPGNVKKYDGIPPFEGTRNYVNKVMGYCGNNITAGFVPNASIEASGQQNTLSAAADDNNIDSLSTALLMSIFREIMGNHEF